MKKRCRKLLGDIGFHLVRPHFPTPAPPDAGARPGGAAATVRKPYLICPARFWPHRSPAVLGAAQA